MNFIADKTVGFSGGGLLEEVHQFKMNKLVELFPEGCQEGYYEPEKGYDHPYELTFRGPDGVAFRIYERYGVCRIGGWGEKHLEAFKAWVTAKVNGS